MATPDQTPFRFVRRYSRRDQVFVPVTVSLPFYVLALDLPKTIVNKAGRIGESVDGIGDIHVNGTVDHERAAIATGAGADRLDPVLGEEDGRLPDPPVPDRAARADDPARLIAVDSRARFGRLVGVNPVECGVVCND